MKHVTPSIRTVQALLLKQTQLHVNRLKKFHDLFIEHTGLVVLVFKTWGPNSNSGGFMAKT